MLKKGFTLIELLVVIAIIGILGSIIFILVGSDRAQARDTKRLDDLRSMITLTANFSSASYAQPLGCSGPSPFLTTNCSILSQYSDPSGAAVANTTCSKPPFAKACQYTVEAIGSVIAPTTESFEVCAYLEQGVSGYSKGDVYVSTSNPTVTAGCP